MDVSLNVPVYCTDGLCGHVDSVILHAKERTVKSIVVKTNTKPVREWIVPVADITDSTPDHVRINCTQEQLMKKRPFRVATYIAEDVPVYDDAAMTMIWGEAHVPKVRRYVEVEHPNLDVGELAMSYGARVRATDGAVGRVREMLVDPDTGRMTHLVLKKGNLWGQKEVVIPASAIDVMGEKTVYLNISKSEIEALPAKPVRPKSLLSRA